MFGFGEITDTTNVQNLNQAALKWSLGFGGGLAKKGKPTLNDPATVQGIRFYKELYDAPYTPKGAGSAQLRELMWEGKLAMWIDGAWLFGMIQGKNPELYKHIDAVMCPTPTKAAIIGGAYWGIGNKPKDLQATWKVMNSLNSPLWQQKYLEMTTQIPGQSGMVTEGFARKNPWIKVFDEAALKYGAGHGYIPEGFDLVAEQYHQIVADYLSRILARNAPIEKTLDALQAELVKTFVK